MGAEVCRVNLLERNVMLSSGRRKEAQLQNCQGGGSHYGCSQVEIVEITHYPYPAFLLCLVM